jgi:hypothetical protein
MQEHMPQQEVEVGFVTHYWTHLGVAGVHLEAPLDVGDHIHVLGHTSDFEQDVDSLQLWHHEVRHADEGDDIGIRVSQHVHEHDKVYKAVDVAEIAASESDL